MSCTPKTSVIVYVNYTSITLQTKITKLKEKKIRDTKGTFHAKMGTIKDRHGGDLTEAEDIKKKRKEYRGKNYAKKVLMTHIITIVCSLPRARHLRV